MSDNELGRFLRVRRERLSPGEAGLPAGPRRRTPGLRRAELAMLADISVEYLTRLEQGRDHHPSMQVLATLASALRLSEEEHRHLVLLAKATSGVECQLLRRPAETVRPAVRALLNRLEPTPAFVMNRLTDVLGHTSGFERLAGPLGLLDARKPNLIRYTLTDVRARCAYPDWEQVADERFASIKVEIVKVDPHVAEFVNELSRAVGAATIDRLRATRTIPKGTGQERLVHPEVGELRLAYESLDLPDTGAQRLIVYLPADDATATALDRLAGRQPGALRALTG